MKGKNSIGLISLLGLILLMGACNDDVYDELPESVAKFVSEYYPFSTVSSYSMNGDNYVVKMHNGATLVFDRNLSWIDFDGNGVTLPENFIYNCLPESLYSYIQETQATSGIYRVTRDSEQITIYLEDTYFVYILATGQITYPSVRDIAGLYF